jgi:hypothetical protein
VYPSAGHDDAADGGVHDLRLVGYRQLPISALPKAAFPAIVITAALDGASAETMASAVATPIEKHLLDVSSGLQIANPEAMITIDQSLALRLGNRRRPDP